MSVYHNLGDTYTFYTIQYLYRLNRKIILTFMDI